MRVGCRNEEQLEQAGPGLISSGSHRASVPPKRPRRLTTVTTDRRNHALRFKSGSRLAVFRAMECNARVLCMYIASTAHCRCSVGVGASTERSRSAIEAEPVDPHTPHPRAQPLYRENNPNRLNNPPRQGPLDGFWFANRSLFHAHSPPSSSAPAPHAAP